MGPDLARRWRLRLDRPVLRRDADTLQVGLGPCAVRLPDSEEVRRLLATLDPLAAPGHLLGSGGHAAESAQPPSAATERIVHRLREAGHLETVTEPAPGVAPRSIAVSADARVRERLGPLLREGGLSLGGDDPSVWLVVTAGPARRSLVDDLVRAQVPHLVVETIDGVRSVGPFVQPGRTACLRCIDAHHASRDPRHPLLVEQAARAAEERPTLVDPLADRLALAWAVRDLATFAYGGTPPTWSATVRFEAPGPRGADHRPLEVIRTWDRHPHCGCAWDALLDLA